MLATWWEPGHGVPVWRYFGAELDRLPLLFLFVIFFVSDAGQEWGLDGAFVRLPTAHDEQVVPAAAPPTGVPRQR